SSFFFATAGWGAVLPFQKKKFLLKKIHSARINLFFGAGLAACSFFRVPGRLGAGPVGSPG
ncbi:hypothetical protein, partial [Desulfovibrio sp.]|uniref:hypothetical protein n=1 Tax=Desulfovibrio sp. TaxID=885 RepID=UPI003AB1CD2B